MPRDYYEVLGVGRDASERDIKKAFRVLARELHPDVNAHDPAAEEKFKEAAEAYEVLTDADRRATYDRFGHEGLRTGGWSPRTEGFGSFEDIFSAFFGADSPFGFGPQGPAAGADVAATVEIDLAEVVTGVSRDLQFEAVVPCERCKGNGAEPGTPIVQCDRCEGSGQLRRVTNSPFGQIVRATTCDRCGGDGKVAETPCTVCQGAGRVTGERTWQVDVPAGIESGQRIRLGGGGHAGESGAPPGDLYVQVLVRDEEGLERDGTDLVSSVDISAPAAMVGTTVPVHTLEGERDLEVPAGSQPGDVLPVSGLGLPPLGGGKRGDQRVVLNVIVPTGLSAEQQRLAEELDGTVTEDNLSREHRGLFARLRRSAR